MNGVVLIRGIILSGGRSGSKNPSSRRANHSLNVVCFMSKEELQHIIKSDKTDHLAIHKGSALKKIKKGSR